MTVTLSMFLLKFLALWEMLWFRNHLLSNRCYGPLFFYQLYRVEMAGLRGNTQALVLDPP